MEHFIQSIELLVAQNSFPTYIIIYVGTIFLGNLMAFTALWVAFHGTLGAWGVAWVILTIFLANTTGDISWYWLGRLLSQTRLGLFIERHIPRRARLEYFVQKHDRRLVFVSKFLYSAAFPVIFSIGWSKMSFKRFFRISLTALCFSLPLITLITYGLYSGIGLLRARAMFQRFEIIFSIGLIVFIALNYFISRIVKKGVFKEEKI